MVIGRTYTFESAHWLPRVAETHKCHRLHGHNYKFEVILNGAIDDKGWLMDFWDVDAIVMPIVNRVDHRCLNDIPGLENPTAEIIAKWFRDEITQSLKKANHSLAVRIKLWETPDAYAFTE